jgi:hypothetical protein
MFRRDVRRHRGRRRARGQPRLTLGQALLVPVRRLPAVLGWSLLAAGVGLILQGVVDRIPLAGRVLAWFGGVVWALATIFAVPLLVLEDAGPLTAARRSGRLARERWGETLGGTVSIAFWSAVPSGIAGALLAAGIATHATVARAILLGVAIAIFAVVGGLTAATRELFTVALYRYAVAPADAAGGVFPVADLAHPPARGGRGRRRRRSGDDAGPGGAA